MHSKKRLISLWLEEKEDWDEDTVEYYLHVCFRDAKTPLLAIQLRNHLRSSMCFGRGILCKSKGLRRQATNTKKQDFEFNRLFGDTTQILIEEIHNEFLHQKYFMKLKVDKKPDSKIIESVKRRARSNERVFRKHVKRETKKYFDQLMHRAIFKDYVFTKPLTYDEQSMLENRLIQKFWIDDCKEDLSCMDI